MLKSLLKFVSLSAFAVAGAFAAAGQLQEVRNYGTNPTGVQMFVYRPSGLIANPALIVAMHYCTGTAQAYFSGTQYANLADSLKTFMVIYPDAPDSGGCWDVHSTGTLTHNGGGDSIAIVSQVKYAITNYGVDASRVFMTGTSSGAMMTNVLAGAYPDVFAAGAAFAGVPYGCFAGAGMWNNECANGQKSMTAQQWGDLVRSGYPGYTGEYPKLQIWQGTGDTTLNYRNLAEGVKQWTNVFGYPSTGTAQSNSPVNGWTRTIYGPRFQAIVAQGVDHNIPVQANDVLNWFGITGNQAPTTTAGPTTPPPSPSDPVTSPPVPADPVTTPPPVPTTPAAPQQTHYGQCGGQGWNGPTECVAPYTCKAQNQWYSQCT